MELKEIKEHWENWAQEYKTDLRATTKASTAKQVEVHALMLAIQSHCQDREHVSILEVGCGNGYNCFHLQENIPNVSLTGVDYVNEMVYHAKDLNETYGTDIAFYPGDVLDLTGNEHLKTSYDVVFTNRCLINLNSDELQHQAIEQLVEKLADDGYLILIENQWSTYNKQNQLRESVDLKSRKPATFNHFMDETLLLRKMDSLGLTLIEDYNFSSLHDVMLYVLLPMINGGKVDYEHPLVQAAADLTCQNGTELLNGFGDFGQNKLFIFKKH